MLFFIMKIWFIFVSNFLYVPQTAVSATSQCTRKTTCLTVTPAGTLVPSDVCRYSWSRQTSTPQGSVESILCRVFIIWNPTLWLLSVPLFLSGLLTCFQKQGSMCLLTVPSQSGVWWWWSVRRGQSVTLGPPPSSPWPRHSWSSTGLSSSTDSTFCLTGEW